MTTPLIHQGVEVLAVLNDRKKETVVNFFASIPFCLRQIIERVCTDMYLGFVNAARIYGKYLELYPDSATQNFKQATYTKKTNEFSI